MKLQLCVTFFTEVFQFCKGCHSEKNLITAIQTTLSSCWIYRQFGDKMTCITICDRVNYNFLRQNEFRSSQKVVIPSIAKFVSHSIANTSFVKKYTLFSSRVTRQVQL